MISKHGTDSQIISLTQIPETAFNDCDLTENTELYNIVKELVNKNDYNIKSLSTFVYDKILKKIAYLLFLIKLYT
jgi:ribonuclease HIII